jgi:hypothetical protein
MIGFTDTFIHNSGRQAIPRYRRFIHFAAHRCTRTTVSRLYWWYPGNGFITVSLPLQITYKIFFAQSNLFPAISSQTPSAAIPRTRLSSLQQLTQINSSSTELSTPLSNSLF